MSPPVFELFTGPTSKYYYFEDEIIRRIQQRKDLDYDFIYLLPVKRAVRYLKERLIDHKAARVLPDPPIYTFYEFMVELYRSFPEARKVVSPAMQLFLVEEVLRDNVDQLRFFSSASAQRRGLIRKVDVLLNELREYGHTSATLVKAIEAGDQRVHDFGLIIEAFEKLLGDQLVDEAGAIQGVFQRLTPEFWQEKFPKIKTIYLSGYGLFSRPMIDFFERVRTVCSVKIKLDYLPDHPQLFQHVDPAFQALQELNPQLVSDKAPVAPWIKRLFQRHLPADAAPVELDKDVLIQPANSRREEVAFIAGYLRRLHRHHNIPLHLMGLTFPSLENYALLIREIFPRHGLPFNMSTGYQLNQSPLIRSFLLMLEVPLSGFDVKKLLQFVSSPFYEPQDQSLKADPGEIKRATRDLRLQYFSRRWEGRFEEYSAYLEENLESAARDDDFDAPGYRESLKLLTNLRPKLEGILGLLQQLQEKQSVTDFRGLFFELLEKFGFLDWYKRNKSDLKESDLEPREHEQEYRAFNRFTKLFDQFSWIVSNLHGDDPLSLDELHQYLKLLVDQATYNLREWDNFGVQIMPRLEILSTTPEVLVFGGMIEGDFPRPFIHDVFFHDEEREQMGLSATEDLLGQDRYMFYSILNSPAKRLVFSYPRFIRESARVPSNFLNVLADQARVRWRQQLPSQRFLQNNRDILEEIARQIPAWHSAEPQRRRIDQRRMQLWLALNAENRHKTESVRFWLKRVEIIAEKRRQQHFGPYEGMLSDSGAIVTQLRERYQDRPFSITRLENFAFCPIRFFFQYHMKIAEEEEIEQGLTPLERGELVHQTLFQFYSTLRENGLQDRPWEAAELLKEIAEAAFARLPFKGLLFDLEREKYFGSGGRMGMWEHFLRIEEKQIGQLGFRPALFEVAFGRAGRKSDQDPVSIDQPLALTRNGKTVKVIGKIDRVDLNEAGQALLIDYKTGSSFARAAEVYAGISLQLPLYAAVLPKLLNMDNRSDTVDPVMAAIFQVKDAENCQRIPVIFDKDAGINIAATAAAHAPLPNKHFSDDDGNPLGFDQMVQRSEDFVFDYVERIMRGEFRHTRYPDNAACSSYCDYRRMCRKDVRKLRE